MATKIGGKRGVGEGKEERGDEWLAYGEGFRVDSVFDHGDADGEGATVELTILGGQNS